MCGACLPFTTVAANHGLDFLGEYGSGPLADSHTTVQRGLRAMLNALEPRDGAPFNMPDARRPKPGARNLSRETDVPSAYVSALQLLSRRELSEAQVRQRLTRKGYPEDDIEAAVGRLKAERALDDVRVAAAMARTSAGVKRRGKLRVRRELENAGIAPGLAREAIEAVFEEVDADDLLQASLGRRLKSDRAIDDDREFQRLYRYLTAQGFESDRILRALNARRGRRVSGSADPDSE